MKKILASLSLILVTLSLTIITNAYIPDPPPYTVYSKSSLELYSNIYGNTHIIKDTGNNNAKRPGAYTYKMILESDKPISLPIFNSPFFTPNISNETYKFVMQNTYSKNTSAKYILTQTMGKNISTTYGLNFKGEFIEFGKNITSEINAEFSQSTKYGFDETYSYMSQYEISAKCNPPYKYRLECRKAFNVICQLTYQEVVGTSNEKYYVPLDLVCDITPINMPIANEIIVMAYDDNMTIIPDQQLNSSLFYGTF